MSGCGIILLADSVWPSIYLSWVENESVDSLALFSLKHIMLASDTNTSRIRFGLRGVYLGRTSSYLAPAVNYIYNSYKIPINLGILKPLRKLQFLSLVSIDREASPRRLDLVPY
jgi:hypothetical protein